MSETLKDRLSRIWLITRNNNKYPKFENTDEIVSHFFERFYSRLIEDLEDLASYGVHVGLRVDLRIQELAHTIQKLQFTNCYFNPIELEEAEDKITLLLEKKIEGTGLYLINYQGNDLSINWREIV